MKVRHSRSSHRRWSTSRYAYVLCVPEPSCRRRNRSASAWTVPSGHTAVHDRRPSLRSICWTRKSPTTTRRATHPPYRLQNMTDVPDTVGQQARDDLVTVPDGHHGQDYLRSVNSTMTGDPFSSSPSESIRPPWTGPVPYSLTRKRTAQQRLHVRLDQALHSVSTAARRGMTSAMPLFVAWNRSRPDTFPSSIRRSTTSGTCRFVSVTPFRILKKV
ncbi:hypothetical protein T261_07537 [Streptomyces lydicus]|nr:hypothetical protein T261_07537 [Streptomyces lydicus]